MLSFPSPYEAIAQISNPTTIVTVRDFFDKYLETVQRDLPVLRDGQVNPEIPRIDRLGRFLEPYRQGSVAEFGPDELWDVRRAMVELSWHGGQVGPFDAILR